MITLKSGNAIMNDRAAALISSRPTAGAPPLIVNDPSGAKNVATLAASWLHHAALYRSAKFLSSAEISCMIPILPCTPQLWERL